MGRIRTVKPEFWTSQKLAGLSDRARLLAIALLNHSDDEGYFQANIQLVRAACFPFDEDSVTTHGAITELSNMGYIEVKKTASGNEVGRVVNFDEHQRVNRPKPSVLSGDFQGETLFSESSVKDHGGVTDSSLLEGNREQGSGTGNREQGKEGKIAAKAAGPPLNPQEVLDEWNQKMDQRCELTEARKRTLKVRAKDPKWIERWSEAIAKASTQPFLLGENNRGWKADFEWFLKPDSLTKILEGKYTNSGKPPATAVSAGTRYNPETAGSFADDF